MLPVFDCFTVLYEDALFCIRRVRSRNSFVKGFLGDGLECDRPVSEEEVNIFQPHVLQYLVQAYLYILWSRKVWPEFGSNKDLRARDTGFFYSKTNFFIHLNLLSSIHMTCMITKNILHTSLETVSE
jgi:hypothetical protein